MHTPFLYTGCYPAPFSPLPQAARPRVHLRDKLYRATPRQGSKYRIFTPTVPSIPSRPTTATAIFSFPYFHLLAEDAKRRRPRIPARPFPKRFHRLHQEEFGATFHPGHGTRSWKLDNSRVAAKRTTARLGSSSKIIGLPWSDLSMRGPVFPSVKSPSSRSGNSPFAEATLTFRPRAKKRDTRIC